MLEKDSTLKSTRREHELEVLSLQQVRNDMKIDIDNLKDNLLDEKSHKKELEDKYANDLLTIEKEIEITMPTIVDDIASKVNRNWEKRMKAEIGSMQLKYESEIESLRKEILEIHSSFAERDARRRVQLVDEKAEIEDMRLLVAGLKQTMGITSDPSVSFHHSHNLIPILNPTSRSYLTDSEVVEPLNDIGEQSEKLRCKEKEQRYKRSSIEAFSQLQAQVNTMKHELTNTITSKMKAPLKLLKTESDLFGAFEGDPTFNGLSSQEGILQISQSMDISPIPMKDSRRVTINSTEKELNTNELDSFYLETTFADGGWRSGYWRSKYFSR